MIHSRKKLVILCTHPIQYYAPVFKMIASSDKIDLHVLYTAGATPHDGRPDKNFGKIISWDIPLLDGYSYTFLANHAPKPGSHHYSGIDNPDIIRQISQLQPDCLMVYGWAYKSHLKTIRHFKSKIPVLFRGDSTLLDERSGLRSLIRRIALKWVYRHIDKALYVGTQNKNYYLKHGLKPAQLVFAPHAVDNERFASPSQSGITRTDIGVQPNDMVVLYAGKLYPKKNPLLLLQAFLTLNIPGVHLVIAGNGILQDELQQIAKNNDRVHFIDFVNQSKMPSLYQLADLFCLPSINETWGLSVNEAMAAGCAVLVSDHVGCAADLVTPGINGDIFKSGDITDLTKKLEFLLSDRPALVEMGKVSANLISNWAFDIQKEQIIDTVLQL